MAVSLRRNAFVELSANLRLSRNGGRFIWDYLFRSSAGARTRMVARRGRITGKDPRTDRTSATNLERRLAQIDNRSVPYERFNLVDSVWAISLRFMAEFQSLPGRAALA